MAQFDNIKNLRPRSKTTLKVTGKFTGEVWAGEFEFYRILTHRQQLEKDRIRRELLGEHGNQADPNIRGRANAFADLQVRIINAPEWWTTYNGGLDLVDDDILIAVYEAVIKDENEFVAERLKKVADAKRDLEGIEIDEEPPPQK